MVQEERLEWLYRQQLAVTAKQQVGNVETSNLIDTVQT